MDDHLLLADVTKVHQSFHAFGFEIPLTNDGRRIWTPRFKRFVIAKFKDGEFTIKQIEDECQVSSSQVYQWKMNVEGKDTSPREYRRRKQKLFTEVTVQKCQNLIDEPVDMNARIEITLKEIQLSLPCDYPVSSLVTILAGIQVRQ